MDHKISEEYQENEFGEVDYEKLIEALDTRDDAPTSDEIWENAITYLEGHELVRHVLLGTETPLSHLDEDDIFSFIEDWLWEIGFYTELRREDAVEEFHAVIEGMNPDDEPPFVDAWDGFTTNLLSEGRITKWQAHNWACFDVEEDLDPLLASTETRIVLRK